MWCKPTAFAQQCMSYSNCDRGNAIVESKRKWRIPADTGKVSISNNANVENWNVRHDGHG
jgi:hypothetical protein